MSEQHALALSAMIVRQSLASADSRAIIKKWRTAFDWRPCTCVRCNAVFGKRRPKVFFAVSPDRFQSGDVKAFFCEECSRHDDDALLAASMEYIRSRHYPDASVIEIEEGKILHVEPVAEARLGLSHVFVAADAQIFPPPERPPRLDARSVFGGAVYQDYLSAAGAGAAGLGAEQSARFRPRRTCISRRCWSSA
jgi:hypothetical protein